MTTAIALDKFIETCFTEAWRTFAKDPALYIIGGLIVAVVGGITFGICMGPLMVGFYIVAKRRRQGETVAVGDIFNGFQRFWPAFLTALLVGIAAVIGSFLCVLPGLAVVWLAMFAFAAVALEGLDSVDAIGRSFKLTTTYIPLTLLLFLALAILSAIGNIVVVGFLVTLPFSLLVTLVAFEQLKGNAAAVATTSAPQA
jgi:uncharacterized membrane protein